MLTIISVTTANLFRTFFEGNEQKEAVAFVVELLANGFKILQSRRITLHCKDKFNTAYRVHLEDQEHKLSQLYYFLEKSVWINRTYQRIPRGDS